MEWSGTIGGTAHIIGHLLHPTYLGFEPRQNGTCAQWFREYPLNNDPPHIRRCCEYTKMGGLIYGGVANVH